MARGVATDKKVREIIIRQYATGNSMSKIADNLNMAKSTIGDIIKKYGDTGNVDIRGKSMGRPKIITERKRRVLLKICKQQRRSVLRDIQAQWNQEADINVSRECCRQWIHKSGYGFYKVNVNNSHTTNIITMVIFLGKRKATFNTGPKEETTYLGQIEIKLEERGLG